MSKILNKGSPTSHNHLLQPQHLAWVQRINRESTDKLM